jgi:UDP-2-acetamido-3-amino-2,3-dideoxy-glucuronate N-acetyltransferase
MGFVHKTAEVSEKVNLGHDVQIWNYSHIRDRATIGDFTIIGRNVYIGPGVLVGRNSKIQNNALIYEPAVIEEGVFIGPAVILTNDQYPRAVNPDQSQKSTNDWTSVGVTVREGASIGAGCICVAPIEIGKWSLVGAGSTVIKNVPAFAMVVGTPARWINWVGKAGFPLQDLGSGSFKCPKTGAKYLQLDEETLIEDANE